jgi:hypothetical protein
MLLGGGKAAAALVPPRITPTVSNNRTGRIIIKYGSDLME